MKQGWIKLHRCVTDNWLFNDDRVYSKFEAWLDMLMTARWSEEPDKVFIQGKIVQINRGQSIKSLETWGSRWGWSKSKVHRFFDLLRKENMIVTDSVGKMERLTIVNYDTYQSTRDNDGTMMGQRWDDDGTKMGTEEEGKKGKKDKKEKNNTIEQIYKAYPKHVGKGHAVKAIEKAIKRLTDGDDKPDGVELSNGDVAKWLLDTVSQYAKSPDGKRGKFTPHPATWFNGKKYLDDKAEWSAKEEPDEPTGGCPLPGFVPRYPTKAELIGLYPDCEEYRNEPDE